MKCVRVRRKFPLNSFFIATVGKFTAIEALKKFYAERAPTRNSLGDDMMIKIVSTMEVEAASFFIRAMKTLFSLVNLNRFQHENDCHVNCRTS